MLYEHVPLLISASLFGLLGVSWDAIDRRIDREFPEVTMITQDELAARLASDDALQLIDVRAAEEFQVSHLPGAKHLTSAEAIAAAHPNRDTHLVVYCSVGYRSAAVAAELEQLGYRQVYNLRHSIFAWANAQQPLVNAQGPTDKAHPFNFLWGRLLDDAYRQYQP